MVLWRLLAGSHGPMALAGDRCAAVWHPDGTFQFIADAFHVGAGKAEIIKKAFFGPVTPEVPASILQMHPDFTLVGDEEALSLI